MNSLEAITELENKLDIMGYAFEETEIIKQDLEHLKKIEENYYSLNVLCEEIEFENVILEKEKKKLKQAIDIIKIKKIDVFELKFSYSVIEYNIMARNSDFDELTQEEYKLLKEVLGND